MKAIGYFLMVSLLIWLAYTYAGDMLGIQIFGENHYTSALIFAVILSVVNSILGTVFRIITFPLNLLTFGLISFFISLGMIYLTDSFYDNIHISSILGYLAIAFIPSVANVLLGKK